jgi:hypothetical protein
MKMSEQNTETTEEKIKDISLTGIGFNFLPGRDIVGQVVENLSALNLKSGQRGHLISTDKGYVFERVGIHLVENIDKVIILEVETKSGKCLDRFKLTKNGVERVAVRDEIGAGTLLEHEKLFLKNVSPKQDLTDLKGRICLIIRGYKAETWR